MHELRADNLIVGVEVERELHADEPERRQRLLRRRFLFELVVLHRRLAEQKREERIGRGDARRKRRVEPLHGREVWRGQRRAASPTGPSRLFRPSPPVRPPPPFPPLPPSLPF